jgi:signal transduction histidine kinase
LLIQIFDVPNREEAEQRSLESPQHAQLQRLTSQLVQAEQRERRRLAQVLHDQLQPYLVAARLKIELLGRHFQDDALRPTLQQIDQLLEQAVVESRSLTVELSPPVLYQHGLAAGLKWLAQWIEEKHGLPIRTQLDPEASPLAEAASTLLFQAVRELLFNVVKHAQAEWAELTLRKLDDDQVQIIVTDLGLGFDPAQLESRDAADCFGLFSIRERLAAIGGRLEITSAPGRGTSVRLHAPRRWTAS